MVNNGSTEEARDSLAEIGDLEQLQNDYDSGEDFDLETILSSTMAVVLNRFQCWESSQFLRHRVV